MAVSTAKGGALENVNSAAQTGAYPPSGITNVFCVMSNELSTPKILYCTSDTSAGRGVATNFPQLGTPSPNTTTQGTNCISYFVCGDAADTYPAMILDGDRNLGTVTSTQVGQYAPGIYFSGGQIWPNTKVWAWSGNEMHLKVGNIGMADGSVVQTTPSSLWAAMLNATNGSPYATPYYNFPN
jgi:hypothetical protein